MTDTVSRGNAVVATTPATRSVLQIGNEWPTVRAGGLNRYAEGLSTGLTALGVTQRWLVMGRLSELPPARADIVGVAAADAPLLKRWAAMQSCFREEMPGHSDVVSSHFALYSYSVTRQLARLPHVVHFHGPWAAESNVEGAGRIATAVKKHMERAVYHTADRFITLSRAFSQVLVDHYGVDESKVRIVPGGVDIRHFNTQLGRHEARVKLGWPTNRPIVLCVRRLARRMGIDVLVDAISKLRQKHSDLLVMVAGKGPLESEMRARIEAANLSEVVQLVGFVADEVLPLAYRAADLSVVPTLALEGFGLIVLESLAAGTPVLVTPVGGLPEVVQGIAPQLVLESSTVDAIASGLDAALSGALSLPSSARCQAYVRENFAWPTIARRVFDLYEEAQGVYK